MHSVHPTIQHEDFRWLPGRGLERKPSSGIRVCKEHLELAQECAKRLGKLFETIKPNEVYRFDDGDGMYQHNFWHYPTVKKTARFWFVKQWSFETKTIRLDRETLEKEGQLIHKPTRGWYTIFELGKQIKPRVQRNLKGMQSSIDGIKEELAVWEQRQIDSPDEWFEE